MPDLPCFFVIHRLMGTHGEQTLRVPYSLPFRVGALVVLSTSLLWVLNFFASVLPETAQASEGPCRFSDDQLRQNSIVLFAYFLCFAVVRICIFFPGVAARVAEIQTGNQGAWRMYALHMILHGPLYIFGIGSVLFGFQLLMSPKCENDPDTPALHRKLGWYSAFSCFIFAACLLLAFVHGRIINRAARNAEEERRRAPKGTLEKLLTLSYDPELFGDEDGKRYPGECPICLEEWDEDSEIKVTLCEHAFHKECIGHWLENERTCAFCRQDVVNCSGRSSSTPRNQSAPFPMAGDLGDGSAASTTATAPPPVADAEAPPIPASASEAVEVSISPGAAPDVGPGSAPEPQVIGLSAEDGDRAVNEAEQVSDARHGCGEQAEQDIQETTV